MPIAFIRRHPFASAAAAAALILLAFVVFMPAARPSRQLVREIAAPDHVWHVDPATGLRRYIGSGADAEAVIAATARPMDEAEAGGFARDAKGRAWFVHDDGRKRERVPEGDAAVRFLIARSRELSRNDLKEILVAGDSPEWLVPPPGYRAEIVAGGLTRPRVLDWDPAGRLVVSEHVERGRITAYGIDAEGRLHPDVILDGRSRGRTNLFNAHGFAFLGGRLYVASEHVLESWPYDARTASARGDGRLELELSPGSDRFAGQGHRTRTVVAGSDGKLYLSIGSSCDACADLDLDAYAVVKRLSPGGRAVETFARGLRNAVFLVEDRARGLWWANEMGRDDLGEELPPDELNVLAKGKDYGWPLCYGDRVRTPDAGEGACDATEPASHAYPAHTAPLGLRLIPASFRPDWEGDLLVAEHGSTIRERSVAGYKIVRLDLDPDGNVLGEEDVVTGFLKGMNVPAGRPVDLQFGPDGALYVTDDHAGVIHRIRKVGQ